MGTSSRTFSIALSASRAEENRIRKGLETPALATGEALASPS
jgi:hypothetical protein